MLQLLYPWETQYPLHTGLGGPQSQSGQVCKISPLQEFDPWTVQPIARCYINYANQTPCIYEVYTNKLEENTFNKLYETWLNKISHVFTFSLTGFRREIDCSLQSHQNMICSKSCEPWNFQQKKFPPLSWLEGSIF